MSIVAWVSLLSYNEKLRNWLTMQCIKKESTLRISPKGNKPSPRIISRWGKEGNEIRNYLENKRLIKKIIRKLHKEYVHENLQENI
jgi:hypothetical protein